MLLSYHGTVCIINENDFLFGKKQRQMEQGNIFGRLSEHTVQQWMSTKLPLQKIFENKNKWTMLVSILNCSKTYFMLFKKYPWYKNVSLRTSNLPSWQIKSTNYSKLRNFFNVDEYNMKQNIYFYVFQWSYANCNFSIDKVCQKWRTERTAKWDWAAS